MEDFREAVGDLTAPLAADLLESENAYLVVLDIPGAAAETTTVETTNGSLRVETDRTPPLPEDALVVHDGRPDELSLELPLPADADASETHASLTDGVLEVTIPRRTSGTSIPIEGE